MILKNPQGLAGAAVALMLTLSACGGSPTASGGRDSDQESKAEAYFAEVGALTGEERRTKLVEAAEDEGELNLYTSMTSEVVDEVVGVFSDTFDIDVNVYRAGSETVLQRILQESGAGFSGSDIVETNALEMFALQNEELLAIYEGEQRDKVSDAGKFDDWTATRYNIFEPSWNTEQVSASEAPTSWEDLADPKWDGKLAMELSDYDWYLTLSQYWLDQGKSQEEVDKLFSEMADGAKVVKGHTVMGELLSAGQFALAASNYTYLVAQVKAKGAPVDYQPLTEPAIVRPNGIGLLKNAEHPAAAMLFADWLLEEGQQVLVDLGLTPSVPPKGAPSLLDGIESIPIDLDTLLSEGDEWSAKYEQLLEGGEEIDG